ncbi:hypothetical protein BDN71DRAFT_1451027 [Pleurotus eryngii]|uniref:Uncharacterized protein n=1 Tax=Pleurotus eryngii TaxID=5323 RepID=A0A9P6DEN8_PLEER|nr:hypothetical protein BDN71DRAFT_1451027 [Pleurotus eryngii]
MPGVFMATLVKTDVVAGHILPGFHPMVAQLTNKRQLLAASVIGSGAICHWARRELSH